MAQQQEASACSELWVSGGAAGTAGVPAADAAGVPPALCTRIDVHPLGPQRTHRERKLPICPARPNRAPAAATSRARQQPWPGARRHARPCRPELPPCCWPLTSTCPCQRAAAGLLHARCPAKGACGPARRALAPCSTLAEQTCCNVCRPSARIAVPKRRGLSSETTVTISSAAACTQHWGSGVHHTNTTASSGRPGEAEGHAEKGRAVWLRALKMPAGPPLSLHPHPATSDHSATRDWALSIVFDTSSNTLCLGRIP